MKNNLHNVDHPIVSVVCLCHNHARFLEETLYSVRNQTYPHVQLIVVDDASDDGSKQIIESIVEKHPDILYISLKKNIGNCSAFNIGLRYCTGEFIIDLATDDVLLPNRIEAGIKTFQHLGSPIYGVHFSDAEIIDESGITTGYHSDRFPHDSIPRGNVYKELIARYFINTSTMMIRKSVFDMLNGYDETLAYEDFDFWIRSSRHVYYCYTPQPLVRRRIVKNSMARRQFRSRSPQRVSTYRVCEKIKKLNRTKEEDRMLCSRIGYEIRMCLRVFALSLAWRYFILWIKIKNINRI